MWKNVPPYASLVSDAMEKERTFQSKRRLETEEEKLLLTNAFGNGMGSGVVYSSPTNANLGGAPMPLS